MDTKRSRTALLDFLEYLANKGLMNTTTARSRKAAVNGVLGILSEDEAADITSIDLDDVMMRFSNLQGSKFTPDSLQTYRSRVRSSIDDFKKYLENPLTFRPSTPINTRKGREKDRSLSGETIETSEPRTPAKRPPPPDQSILPIPIRENLTIYIQGLPFDLTAPEANKIANVVRAMATQE